MKNPFRIGKRVYLRPLERTDAVMVQPWFNDPEVTRHLLAYRPMNLQNEEEFIDRISKHETAVVVVIVVRETDRPIGTAGLTHVDMRHRHAGFGISIGVKEEWGKGYGTEATALLVDFAFDTLNLHRVWLQVFEYNERARRAYERVGFRKEGVMRQSHFVDGRYWDSIMMAILSDEWRARRENAIRGA
jgi:[ribosomal protein S5]-alanine N-acetyltransferase